MTISRLEFNKQSLDFVQKCKDLNDEWELFKLVDRKYERLDVAQIDSLGEHDLMLTKSVIKPCKDATSQLRTCEYSVTYSESYEVPVMYFTVSNQDGVPFELEKILAIASPLRGDMATIINQVEHPYLFRPFYMVHPCKTSKFMQELPRPASRQYLITWLSTVATLIGLRLNPQLAHH